MIAHVLAAHPDAVRGTELDPAQLRARRDKLIARATELLPKQSAAREAGADLAAQLKNAMRQNAFGDLRFSGRDPVEVIDELRASWAEVGPVLGDEDRAQQARFDDTVQRVLDAARAGRGRRDERPRDTDDDGAVAAAAAAIAARRASRRPMPARAGVGRGRFARRGERGGRGSAGSRRPPRS
jgi:hypothetical protein